MRTLVAYRPLSVLGTAGLVVLALGGVIALIPLSDFIMTGDTSGHLQSLIASVALGIAGIVLLLFGLLADAVAANRRVTEEILYRLRNEQAGKLYADSVPVVATAAKARQMSAANENRSEQPDAAGGDGKSQVPPLGDVPVDISEGVR